MKTKNNCFFNNVIALILILSLSFVFYACDNNMSNTDPAASEEISRSYVRSQEDVPGTSTSEDSSASAGDTEHIKFTAAQVNSFDERYINLYGRTYLQDDMLILDHAATAIEFGINGQTLKAVMYSSTALYICIYVDGKLQKRMALSYGTGTYTLLKGLTAGYHVIRIVKSSEAIDGMIGVVRLDADEFASIQAKSDLKVEFIGDSITVGYAITGNKYSDRTIDN